MKDFEFITALQLADMGCKTMNCSELEDAINQLLNDKCRKGYTMISGGVKDIYVCNTVGGRTDFDTHHAYVFLAPIEPEKAECDHKDPIILDAMKKLISLVQDNDDTDMCQAFIVQDD